jgi:polar amino acid transport system substrate-binding protein
MSGKADLLVADMTLTLPRAMKVAFTKPTCTRAVVFTKAGSKFDSAESCKAPGTKIAVLLGSPAKEAQRRSRS